MNRKEVKNKLGEAKKKLDIAQKKVEQMTSVVQGFNYLTEVKAVVINGNMVHLYRQLWGSNPTTPGAWMQNAYIYLRMKHELPEGKTVYFRDIETDRLIGRYENGKGIFLE